MDQLVEPNADKKGSRLVFEPGYEFGREEVYYPVDSTVEQRILPEQVQIHHKKAHQCDGQCVNKNVDREPFDAMALVNGHGRRLEEEVPQPMCDKDDTQHHEGKILNTCLST